MSSSCVCLSDLETSRGEPGSRFLVQADNSFSARRRPVLWADIQDVVHCLLWGTTFTDRGVLEAPLQHGRAETAAYRPTPVRRRLMVVHCFRGKSRPGTLCGSRKKLCSLEGGAASQSSFQRVLSQDCFVMPGGAPNR